jgi:hypothetical protein
LVPAASWVSHDATHITLAVPAGLSAGATTVAVQNATGWSNNGTFTVV